MQKSPDQESQVNKTNKIRRPKRNQTDSIRWEQKVVQVQRVSKVVKGGKKLSFRATVILGNKNKQVGLGLGKADEVSTAIKKAINDAKKNLISIPLTKNKTVPHEILGIDGASKVFIR